MAHIYATHSLAPSDWDASIESIQKAAAEMLLRRRKKGRGQYLTPLATAGFMAQMLPEASTSVHLLDAGAGAGALFMSAVYEFCGRPHPPTAIRVTAYEIDPDLVPYAQQAMAWCEARCAQSGIPFEGIVIENDFIESAVRTLQGDLFGPAPCASYTMALLNPPYGKITTNSRERQLLRRIDADETNLYSAFLTLALKLLADHGALVAIIPRSFCNGTYFTRFRRQLVDTAVIERMHLFEARDMVFSADDVLQETLILQATRTAAPRKHQPVLVSSGSDSGGTGSLVQRVAYDQVIRAGDKHAIIHIPVDALGLRAMSAIDRLPCSLNDLNLQVSTGKVVEFRAVEHLRQESDANSVPLIASRHVAAGHITWPCPRPGKPEALHMDAASAGLLISPGVYTVVKRVSAKEEKKRLVAAVYGQTESDGPIAFENHLNYFHQNAVGLDQELALGLSAYLNSTLVDTYFRQFSGHTQVNASDLRRLRYPNAAWLRAIGKELQSATPTQETIDRVIQEAPGIMADSSDTDPVAARRRIDEALDVLRQLQVPHAQQNERSALTLLALLDLTPDRPWSMASAPLCGVTQMMAFFARHYGRTYAPNTRETVRRQTLHQYLDAAIVRINPDNAQRPTNSGQTVYQIEEGCLELLRNYGGSAWAAALHRYSAERSQLIAKYAQERFMARIPLKIREGATISLAPGGQNLLIERVVHDFAERFVPRGRLLYIGDAESKFGYYDAEAMASLGVTLDVHGKAPDVIIHNEERNWLGLIEAVTTHGPVNLQRKGELEQLFAGCAVPLVFVSAFMNRKALVKYMAEIAWETEVWLSDEPSHLIHFDGIQRIEPHGHRDSGH